MAKYYHKCCVCNKTVKREIPDFTGRIICNTCKRNENTINCQYCGKIFFKRKSVRKFCSGACSSKYFGEKVLSGRIVSRETREKLSKIGYRCNNGHAKTKYYKVLSLYQNKIVSVQGTYELKYAEYLNANNINWIRSNKIFINYNRDNFDINRNYFPDFYLPDLDEYIEIKGYFFPKDKEKMKLVQEQNTDKKIRILFKEDLIKLNITL
jgi:hypothetical protein